MAEWIGESFNGKFRDECLSLEWFRSRAEAKTVIEDWRKHYNEVRPHSSLGYLTPAVFAARNQGAKRSARAGDGADRCGMWGLHAPPRRTTAPRGHMQRPREAVLKPFRANVIDGDQGHLNVRPSWTEVSLQPPFRLGGDDALASSPGRCPPATD